MKVIKLLSKAIFIFILSISFGFKGTYAETFSYHSHEETGENSYERIQAIEKYLSRIPKLKQEINYSLSQKMSAQIKKLNKQDSQLKIALNELRLRIDGLAKRVISLEKENIKYKIQNEYLRGVLKGHSEEILKIKHQSEKK